MRTRLKLEFARRLAVIGGLMACLIFSVAILVAASHGRAYAQYWGPPDRYIYGPRWTPRDDYDQPPPDERKAKEIKRKVIDQLRDATPPPPTTGPLLLVASIARQKITLYDAGVAIAEAPISSGNMEFPTPTGIFAVLEKSWWHRSNIYSAAPMPFMQRINWEGVALHAGELPGYPASHGCVRLPYDFALRLWQTTKIGARVIISNDEVTPLEIAHARLFQGAAPGNTNATQGTSEANLTAASLSNAPSYPAKSFLAPKPPPPGKTVPPAQTGQPEQDTPAAPPAVVPERVMRPGPVSILVSQRDQRMYVRKGLEPLFNLPITIKHGRHWGTHVFTAVAQGDKALRWVVASIPGTLYVSSRDPAKTQLLAAARDALDRFEWPQEAIERLSPLMSVGATLIVTDLGLGRQASALDSDYMLETP